MTLISLILVSAISSSTFAATLVPELIPGTSGYKEVKQAIDKADKTKYARIADFKLMKVAGQTTIVKDPSERNDDDLAMVINGRYFRIPTEMTMIDNFSRIFSLDGSNGTTPGIYLTQSGFKWNYLTDGYERATASVRLADLSGNVLSSLEYEETSFPAEGTDYKELHPWDPDTASHLYSENPRSMATPRRTQPYPDFTISDENIFNEITMKNFFEKVRNEPENWLALTTFDFQGLKAQSLNMGGFPQDRFWFFNVNDRYFTIPFNFDVFDLRTSLKVVQEGSKPGVYMIQRGFIHNSKRELKRVVAQIRLTDGDGKLLPKLEYHEDHFDTRFSDAETVIERLY